MLLTFNISVTAVPYLCIDLGFPPLDLQAAVALARLHCHLHYLAPQSLPPRLFHLRTSRIYGDNASSKPPRTNSPPHYPPGCLPPPLRRRHTALRSEPSCTLPQPSPHTCLYPSSPFSMPGKLPPNPPVPLPDHPPTRILPTTLLPALPPRHTRGRNPHDLRLPPPHSTDPGHPTPQLLDRIYGTSINRETDDDPAPSNEP